MASPSNVVDWAPLADDRKKRPQIYEETQQVRIRAKNPLIERKPSERDDSGATVSAGPETPPPADPHIFAQMSADGLSLYEQLEHTDRTDEIERAAKELIQATEGAQPRAAMPLEDTKSMVIEPRPREEPKKRKAAKRAAARVPQAAATAPRAPHDPPTDPAPKKAALFMEEEETLIAVGPPQRVGDLEQQHSGFSESDEHVPTLIPGPPPAPSDLPTELPHAVVMRRSVPQQKEELHDLGVVPRRYLGAPGTHGAGAEVHRQLVERIDRELPEVHAVPLKILRGELSGDLLHALEEILDGKHDQRATDGSISPKRTLEHLINEKSYNALGPKDRAKLLMPVAQDPRDVSTIKSGIAILKTRVLERLPDHQRARLLDLFCTLDPDARATLVALAARQLRGRPVMEDRDLSEVSLVDRLYGLVNGDPIPELLEAQGVRRERIVKLVLASLVNPTKLSFEEGGSGVISAIEFALADCSPAEYVRLWAGIISKSCAVELAGGAKLELSQRLTAGVAFTNQLTPLRIALDQLPELVQARQRKGETGFVMPGGQGIDAEVVSRALAMVYGVGYSVAAGLEAAARHLERSGRDPQRVPPVFVSLLYDRGERLFTFDHFDDDTVFLRAPHGRSTKRPGAFRSDPNRAVVDPDAGVESVAMADFEEWVGIALVPLDSLRA
jgi:hypothetical protein